MRTLLLYIFLALTPLTVVAENAPQEEGNAFQSLDWHKGPSTENIASKATLKTDKGHAFLDEANSKKFLELTGNIPEDENYILVSTEREWWAAFYFNPMGYVKDDEKIDADALLKQLKSNDEAANEERKRLGISLLYTEGWSVPPHYDSESKRLEWGLKVRDDNGHEVVNYTIRMLGRTGVMNTVLVTSAETLEADVASFKAALPGFEFNGGERYADYQPGDHVAEYGLAALIAGGAAAVATKKGFWAAIVGFFAAAWKAIALGLVAAGAWLRSLFAKRVQ